MGHWKNSFGASNEAYNLEECRECHANQLVANLKVTVTNMESEDITTCPRIDSDDDEGDDDNTKDQETSDGKAK